MLTKTLENLGVFYPHNVLTNVGVWEIGIGRVCFLCLSRETPISIHIQRSKHPTTHSCHCGATFNDIITLIQEFKTMFAR